MDRNRRAGAGVDMTQVAEKLQPWLGAIEERPKGGPRWLQDLRERGAKLRSNALMCTGTPLIRDCPDCAACLHSAFGIMSESIADLKM